MQGLPPHKLDLKVGAIIILLRNINPSEGHVNGTRYVVQNLLPHVIDAVAISGSNIGAKIFIPRIVLNLVSSDFCKCEPGTNMSTVKKHNISNMNGDHES